MAANDDIFDALLRHTIGVRRFSSGELRDIVEILDKADEDLAKLMRKRLRDGESSLKTKRMKLILKDIRELRKAAFKEIRLRSRKGLLDYGKSEVKFIKNIFDLHVPVELNYATVSAERIRALVTTDPFGGGPRAHRTLSQWWATLEAADADRVFSVIALGVTESQTVDDMIRNLQAVHPVNRRNAEAIVRTAVNHVSNASRQAWYEANNDVIAALRWTATLDGRTSAICRARDGHFTPVEGTSTKGVPRPWLQPLAARPPAHPNERSIMTPALDEDGLADAMPDRPFVRDVRTRRRRERDFRAEAREAAGPRWRRMSTKQRNNAIRRRKKAWAREAIGTVPGDTNYDAWLRRQPTAFQNEVLGRGKAVMFRKGLKLDKYVDRRGDELTLEELVDKFPTFAPGV